MKDTKLGRNDPCPCGSGQKYKRCCAAKDAAEKSAQLLAQSEARAAALLVEAEAENPEGASEPAEAKPERRPKRPKLPTSHGGGSRGRV